MFKTYCSLSSLVITSCWFATSRLRVPASVRRVYWNLLMMGPVWLGMNAQLISIIRMMSHDELVVSNHWIFSCLLTVFFRLRTKNTSKLCITGPLLGESMSGWWIPLTKHWSVLLKTFPYHDVIVLTGRDCLAYQYITNVIFISCAVGCFLSGHIHIRERNVAGKSW